MDRFTTCLSGAPGHSVGATRRGIHARVVRTGLAGTIGSVAIVALVTTGAAQASTHEAATSPHTSVGATTCAKVPGSKVSAIVGFTVPATATPLADTIKPSAANDGIGGSFVGCEYGSLTSAANLTKVAFLETYQLSRPLNAAEYAKFVKSTEKVAGAKVSTYTGLGFPAIYFSADESGIFFQGIFGFNGTHGFGSAVYSKTIPTSKVAALTKLAESL